jgi:hypothetical protein
MFLPKHPGYDVRVRDGRHGREAGVLGFVRVDLVTILFDGSFCPFEFGTTQRRVSQRKSEETPRTRTHKN